MTATFIPAAARCRPFAAEPRWPHHVSDPHRAPDMQPVAISRWLAREVEALTFRKPTACTYNPLVYGRRPHET